MRPFRTFRPVATLLVGSLAVSACTGWQRVGAPSGPTAEQQILQGMDPSTLQASLGRLVSTVGVQYTGSVAYTPGPGDTTQAVVALSVANRTFSFQRDGDAWSAHYRLEYLFERPGFPPVRVDREESVRVASFNETLRIDESLILQQVVPVQPGAYSLTVRLTDLRNRAVGTAKIPTTVPAFAPGSVTAPILIYGVTERDSRDDSVKVVLNPRGTVAYGGDTLRLYLEGVGYRTPTDVPLIIRDERDSVIFQQMLRMTGTQEIQPFQIAIAPDRAPLGRLDMRVGDDTLTQRTQAMVSFSHSWLVTNFEELLGMLRYFGHEERISALRRARPVERSGLWQTFLRETDPNPGTPEHEGLERYFARLAYANQRFRDEGISGWRTDRGEVFMTLGEPDEIFDRSRDPAYRYWAWNYNQLQVTLFFHDATGFTRYRLTPESRSAFEMVKLSGRRPD